MSQHRFSTDEEMDTLNAVIEGCEISVTGTLFDDGVVVGSLSYDKEEEEWVLHLKE